MSETELDERIRVRAYHLWQADGCPAGRHDDYWHRAQALEAPQTEKDVDLASEHSFPASDPPAHTGITGPGG